MRLSPYIFSEDARVQAQFYVEAPGGEIVDLKKFAEMPNADPADWERVMHLVMQVGNERIYLADFGPGSVERGDGLDLTLEFPTEAEGKRAFDLLSQGGTVLMPYARMFWGGLYGRLQDAFGVRWQISAET